MKGARAVNLAVLVAALGYFVDIYDLILFSVVRVKSLQGLGVEGPALLEHGLFILNMQMLGMLVGGIVWGILGDRRGRLSVLFGSIILYSLANLANGIPDRLADLTGGRMNAIQMYALVRFVAGVGLAGELGAGITLVSESMRKETRGFGTTIVATVGICGGLVAVFVGKTADWRVAYFIGGGMGLALLILRLGVMESGLFQNLRTTGVSRGNFLHLFRTRARSLRYLSVILVGLPIWYVVGILITFAPELGRALGMTRAPTGPDAVVSVYSGLVLGDLTSGLLSQVLRTRKKVLGGFILLTALFVALYFTVAPRSLSLFYGVCVGLGLAIGYWAVFVSMASEQFGTNLRATVTTTAPNFVRGALVPVTFAFEATRPHLGVTGAALAVGIATLVLALVALAALPETFGRDLDFVEPD
jgi:MFS transporter, putative metabolite:H+ symporter